VHGKKYKEKGLFMSLNIENARVEDDGAENGLGNLRDNPVAKTEALMAVKAAHRQVMEGKPQDAKELAVEKEAEENK
jgi:hypothetical protein